MGKASLFFTKGDSDDPRLGDQAEDCDLLALPAGALCIFGEPDDEGIRLSGGRLGAGIAPDCIRKYLYRMTPSHEWKRKFRIYDLGDPNSGQNLAERHSRSLQLSQTLTSKQCKWIALGGGHDYGYPHAAGFLKGTHISPIILNFDAHLDVRPSLKGHSSGTPFRRLLENFPNAFEFFEIGIQPQCNSPHHWDWAIKNKAHILPLDLIDRKGLASVLQQALDKGQRTPAFLSIDMDVFSQSEAPGCSQSFPVGLSAKEFLRALDGLFEWIDIRAVGIYETSPPLDVDDRTSKLAAQIIHQIIHNWNVRGELPQEN